MNVNSRSDIARVLASLERYGGRSSMWLWRHLKFDPKFPRPVVISGRRYFDEALLDEYDDSMRAAADNGEGT